MLHKRSPASEKISSAAVPVFFCVHLADRFSEMPLEQATKAAPHMLAMHTSNILCCTPTAQQLYCSLPHKKEDIKGVSLPMMTPPFSGPKLQV